MNTQYTVKVRVGSENFWMVPDSGSFELLVPSSACAECHCDKHTYTEPHDHSDRPSRRVDITFGQGTVAAKTWNDTVRLGALQAQSQSFLLLENHKLAHYCE